MVEMSFLIDHQSSESVEQLLVLGHDLGQDQMNYDALINQLIGVEEAQQYSLYVLSDN
jgi:hypothetical protein